MTFEYAQQFKNEQNFQILDKVGIMYAYVLR